MGEVINLKRVKKAATRAAKQKTAAANRLAHGTPNQLRRRAAEEKDRGTRKIEAHKLDQKS